MKTTRHEGYLLYLWCEQEKGRIQQLSEVIGLSRNNIYFQYGKPKLDKKYVDKIAQAGINIPGVTTLDGEYALVVSEPGESYGPDLVKENAVLKMQLQGKEETISALKETISVLRAQKGKR